MISDGRRIQLRRVKGWRKPAGAVTVSRPSRWGNPFPVDEYGRDEAVRLHREWLLSGDPSAQDVYITTSAGGRQFQYDRRWVREHLPDLRGKTLACWCKPDEPCHADVLLELVNQDRSPFTDAERMAYLYGDCALLALAAGELTGWPVLQIVVAEDDDPGELLMRHALVRMPDGRLLDADGAHDPSDESGSEEVTHHHRVVMLAAYAVPFEFGEWEITDQDAHLWRTPEVMADATVLAKFAEDILRRPWPE